MALEHVGLRIHNFLFLRGQKDFAQEQQRAHHNGAVRDIKRRPVMGTDVEIKKINDTYGHDAGDCVLREIASFLMKSVRADHPAVAALLRKHGASLDRKRRVFLERQVRTCVRPSDQPLET